MSLKSFSSSERRLIRSLQVSGFFISSGITLVSGELWTVAIVAGLFYGLCGYWLGRMIVRVRKEKSIFFENELVARIKQYLGLALIVSTLGSAYLWFKAWRLDFSDSYATCLTRGGQACLQTSNPVWTAATLKWLAPLIMVISIAGLFIFALMKNNWPTLILAFLYIVGMSYLALSFEIKNKIGWTNSSLGQFTNTLIPPI
jgi:uncharacterized membrane protein YfcA